MERTGKAAAGAQPSPKGSAAGEAGGGNPLVSNALRTAYEEAVKEEVPAEFLDLLSKLS